MPFNTLEKKVKDRLRRFDRGTDRDHRRTEEMATEVQTHREAIQKEVLLPLQMEVIYHPFIADGYKLSNILPFLLSPSVISDSLHLSFTVTAFL